MVRGPLLAVILLLACGACGDDGPGLAPPPDEITAELGDGATLRVTPDPLRLEIHRDGTAVMAVDHFVEVGFQVGPAESNVYVDPAAPSATIELRPALRAIGSLDPRTLVLELDGGGQAHLSVATDGAITIDAAGDDVVLTRLVLPLAAGEQVHGFGMLPDDPGRTGVIREAQFRLDFAKESSLNELHVPIPLAIFPAARLGFFVEERRVGAFDLGLTRADRVLVTFATGTMIVRAYAGDAFAILDRYTERTGRPAVPPEWAYFPMQWRNVHANADVVLEDAERLRAEDIPGSTVWIDNPWQTGYNDFTFAANFPDPGTIVTDLEALGFKCLLWSTPYVGPDGTTAADFDEAAAAGYLVRSPTGDPFLWPWQDGPGALVDFTAPGATAWWRERIARVTDLGFAGFKLDFGEDLVPNIGDAKNPVVLAAGTPETLHNDYARYYHEAYLGAFPPGEGFLLTRAGSWGDQAVNTAIWPGDLDNDLSRASEENVGGLPVAIANGASLGASGYPFFGSDIGGFRNGAPTGEVLIRWAEYAALGPIMQLGGGGDSHNPWDTALYGAEALPIYRVYARLHADLLPYWHALGVEAGRTGAPITYAPGLVHPGHPWEDAFFSGPAFFVAPVVDAGATTRTVTLPPGDWVDWWTGERVAGGAPVTVPAPLDVLPLWRRVGELIPMYIEPVDTVLPATAPGVLSLTSPGARRLRVVGTFVEGLEQAFFLADASLARITPIPGAGHELVFQPTPLHPDATFELDWPASDPPSTTTGLEVTDADAVAACMDPVGCWFYDAVAEKLYLRLRGLPGGPEVVATVP